LREAEKEAVPEVGSLMNTLGRLFLSCSFVFAAQSLAGTAAQDKTNPKGVDAQKLEKRCNPKIVRKLKLEDKSVQIREGEKSTGYTPLVTFQITEAGEVVNVHLKRSSGFRDYDQAALRSVRSTKYNARPGCPVVESTAGIIIDFR
jgi:TonB family protein